MSYAQEVYEHYANQYRRLALDYQVGDLVYLDSRNVRSNRPSKKLDQKNLGPFSIIRKVSLYAYKLDLPEYLRIYPVKYVVNLRKAREATTLDDLLPIPEATEATNQAKDDEETGSGTVRAIIGQSVGTFGNRDLPRLQVEV